MSESRTTETVREPDGGTVVLAHAGEESPWATELGPGTAAATGRPRDPDLTERAMVTALDIYGRHGWSGFTFGKVAAQARIGKSSLYLRWSTKAELLLAAFRWAQSFRNVEEAVDATYADLITVQVRHRLHAYFGRDGLAMLRLYVERMAMPEVMDEVWSQSMGASIQATRALLKRGVAEGHLVPGSSIVQLGDAIEGGCMMHALATPTHLRPRVVETLDDFAVDFVARTLGPWLTADGGV